MLVQKICIYAKKFLILQWKRKNSIYEETNYIYVFRRAISNLLPAPVRASRAAKTSVVDNFMQTTSQGINRIGVHWLYSQSYAQNGFSDIPIPRGALKYHFITLHFFTNKGIHNRK